MMKKHLWIIVPLFLYSCNAGTAPKEPALDTVHAHAGNDKNNTSASDHSPKTETKTEAEIWQLGNWNIKCDGPVYLSIKQNQAELNVNDNQILIDVVGKTDPGSPDVYRIKLIKPQDLGTGGMRLDWDNFSKDSTIAELKFFKPDHAIYTWLGFYNKKTHKREWVGQSDADVEAVGKTIEFIKCNPD